METLSHETILSAWLKLDWEERHRLVAQHLRDTHYSTPCYKAKADAHSGPMDYWLLLASSCARLVPPWWIAQLQNSYTAANDQIPDTGE